MYPSLIFDDWCEVQSRLGWECDLRGRKGGDTVVKCIRACACVFVRAHSKTNRIQSEWTREGKSVFVYLRVVL